MNLYSLLCGNYTSVYRFCQVFFVCLFIQSPDFLFWGEFGVYTAEQLYSIAKCSLKCQEIPSFLRKNLAQIDIGISSSFHTLCIYRKNRGNFRCPGDVYSFVFRFPDSCSRPGTYTHPVCRNRGEHCRSNRSCSHTSQSPPCWCSGTGRCRCRHRRTQ